MFMSLPIILASGSPRRLELLEVADVVPFVMPVDIDETWRQAEKPVDYIQRMVSEKAEAALTCQSQIAEHCKLMGEQAAIILTADTIGVLADEQVLVKPTDKADAFAMWSQMSDSSHEVWTAVQASLVSLKDGINNEVLTHEALAQNALNKIWQQQILVKTEVLFVPLDEAMMTAYWHSGEPQDKAGGYAIQGHAAAWVSTIVGSYTNVVGLPLAQTLALIAAAEQAHHQLMNS